MHHLQRCGTQLGAPDAGQQDYEPQVDTTAKETHGGTGVALAALATAETQARTEGVAYLVGAALGLARVVCTVQGTTTRASALAHLGGKFRINLLEKG